MKRISSIVLAMLAVSCGSRTPYDAQGTFEATEVVVSSEATGRILYFNVEEGMPVTAGAVVGEIDSIQLHLQRKQLSAQLSALTGSRPDIEAQAASLREQIATQQTECNRVKNLLRDGAATQKQLDDIEAQIRVLESQLTATLSTLGKNTASINDNAAALEAQIAALDDRIAKCRIQSPVAGTVLVKYAETGELASVGKPLMKIADLDHIYLRAYFTSDVEMINQPEPRFTVYNVLPASYKNTVRKHRNVLILKTGQYSQSNMTASYDVNSAPQLEVTITSPSTDSLAAFLHTYGEDLVRLCVKLLHCPSQILCLSPDCLYPREMFPVKLLFQHLCIGSRYHKTLQHFAKTPLRLSPFPLIYYVTHPQAGKQRAH